MLQDCKQRRRLTMFVSVVMLVYIPNVSQRAIVCMCKHNTVSSFVLEGRPERVHLGDPGGVVKEEKDEIFFIFLFFFLLKWSSLVFAVHV